MLRFFKTFTVVVLVLFLFPLTVTGCGKKVEYPQRYSISSLELYNAKVGLDDSTPILHLITYKDGNYCERFIHNDGFNTKTSPYIRAGSGQESFLFSEYTYNWKIFISDDDNAYCDKESKYRYSLYVPKETYDKIGDAWFADTEILLEEKGDL